MSDKLNAQITYFKTAVNVIPLRQLSKIPAIRWQDYQTRWYVDKIPDGQGQNVALVMGWPVAIKKGLLDIITGGKVPDIDVHEYATKYTGVKAYLIAFDFDQCGEKCVELEKIVREHVGEDYCAQRTPRDGLHVIILADRPDVNLQSYSGKIEVKKKGNILVFTPSRVCVKDNDVIEVKSEEECVKNGGVIKQYEVTHCFPLDRHNVKILSENELQTLYERLAAVVGVEVTPRVREREVREVVFPSCETLYTLTEGGVKELAAFITQKGLYRKGNRHNLARNLAGLLRKECIYYEAARAIIENLATMAGDTEVRDRLEAVNYTYGLKGRVKEDREILGYKGLVQEFASVVDYNTAERLADKVVEIIRKYKMPLPDGGVLCHEIEDVGEMALLLKRYGRAYVKWYIRTALDRGVCVKDLAELIDMTYPDLVKELEVVDKKRQAAGWLLINIDNEEDLAKVVKSLPSPKPAQFKKELVVNNGPPDKVRVIDKVITAARHVLKATPITTFYHPQKDAYALYCFNGLMYVPCEETIAAIVRGLAKVGWAGVELRDITTTFRNELVKLLKEETHVPTHGDMKSPWVTLRNELVINGECFAYGENPMECIKELDVDTFSFNYVPHDLNTNLLETIWKHIQNGGTWEELAQKYAPNTTGAFKKWVGENSWRVLYEIIGYTFVLANPLEKAFVLIGPPAAGKTTYLKLVREILGEENVADMPLHEILDSGRQFERVNLRHKMALIDPDVTATPITAVGMLKKLITGERMSAPQKYKEHVWFANYAKIIVGANNVPELREKGEAMWRRLAPVNFNAPIQPKERDPRFLERLKPEIDAIIPLSLFAMRDAVRRKAFATETTTEDVRVQYLRRINSVYDFIFSMTNEAWLNDPQFGWYLQPCECNNKNCEDCRIEVGQLYRLYEDWCQKSGGIFPVPKNKFVSYIEKLEYVEKDGIRYPLRYVGQVGRYTYIGGIKAINKYALDQY
ncbi:MAG: DUF5906 domain-containing protein [Pyrobaculum sp.]